ncbi:MAG: efflux RND transporter periplasmic adaptor subunit [Acidobacteriota bacterium]
MASVGALPKLREDLVRRAQVIRGESMYVYKVIETASYYLFTEFEHRILCLLDGTRNPQRAVEDFNAEHPESPIDVDFLESYVRKIRSMDILEKTRAEKLRVLMEKIRHMRRRRLGDLGKYGTIFQFVVPAWNPDKFFDRMVPRLRFFWSPGFVVFSAACILLMFGLWIAEWDRIKEGTIALYTFEGWTAGDLVDLVVLLLIVAFLHECAHGMTCKYFGGSVTQMGFLMIYFDPCFFCDVSDAYLFDRQYKKQWVIYAGGYLELFICALSTFVWAATPDGTLINDLSYKLILLTGISSIIMNFNPLIKLDGYYSLMDYLEIPDLWERSFAYLSGWVKKTIFKLPVELETATRRVRKILLTYALSSIAYKVLLVAVFLAFLKNILLSRFGQAGYVLFAAAVVLLFRRYILALAGFMKFNLLDKKEAIMAPKSLAILGIVSVSLLLGAVAPPLPVSVRGTFVLEPRSRVLARSAEEGIIRRVLVREGQEVRRGEALAVLRNEDLSWRMRSLRRRLDLTERGIAEATQTGERAALAKRADGRDHLLNEIRILQARLSALTVRSPIDGIVMTARLEERAGARLAPGDWFCEVARPGDLIARIPVREARLDEIRPGQPVELLTTPFPYRTFTGRVIDAAPASGREGHGPGPLGDEEQEPRREGNNFDVIVELTDEADGLMPGTSGTARIRVGRATIAARAHRALRRWLGSTIW